MRNATQVLPGRLLILVTALAALFLLFGTTVQAEQPEITVEHVVEPGESLWDVAQSITPAGEDVRDTLYRVRRLNGLASSTLQVGQQLLLPGA